MDIFADLDEIITEADMPGVDYADHGSETFTKYSEICPKCNGSGRYWRPSSRGVQCFACKGRGKFTYKTPPEVRARARERAAIAKVKLADNTARQAGEWATQHPLEAAWIITAAGRGFGFAVAMRDALAKYGALTERQLETVVRLTAQDAERDAARKAEAEARTTAAPAITVEAIEVAMSNAREAGIKRPRLRLADFVFSPAPASGKNAGALYVKTNGGDYLGKVQGGKFVRAFGVAEEVAAEVVAVAADPKQAAVAYGKKYGSCACCGRELSNPESIALGIGPICAGKYGW